MTLYKNVRERKKNVNWKTIKNEKKTLKLKK